jgi:hypothetical protein
MPEVNSYYDDAPAGGSGKTPSEGSDENSGSKTALIPKSLFGHDLKPGDKCDIEVVAVHEQDYAVKGCSGHEDEKPEDGGGEGEPQPEGSMTSMLED